MITEGARGICQTRANIRGVVYSLCYGNVSSLSNNPIEKKPFFHFAPGTRALTIGSWGCNASCDFCQNYDISKTPPSPTNVRFISPKRFIAMAKKHSEGVSISFNEAATLMLEWNIEAFRLAHDSGLYTTIVTNGYMTVEALDLMIDAGLDAANVDIKGCREQVKAQCHIDVECVWKNIVRMKERGVHVELTTLVVPGLSDEMDCIRSIARRIVTDLDSETPWHINRYFPAYKFIAPPTAMEVLLRAREIAKEEGIMFVYVGNVMSPGLENTICPECGALCYKRVGLNSENVAVDEHGRCIQCGHDLGIRYWPRPSSEPQ